MGDRNVVVRDDSNSVASAGLVLVAVLIIAAVAALFVWQPWRTYEPQHNSTTIQVNPGAAGGSGSTSGSTNGQGSGMNGQSAGSGTSGSASNSNSGSASGSGSSNSNSGSASDSGSTSGNTSH